MHALWKTIQTTANLYEFHSILLRITFYFNLNYNSAFCLLPLIQIQFKTDEFSLNLKALNCISFWMAHSPVVHVGNGLVAWSNIEGWINEAEWSAIQQSTVSRGDGKACAYLTGFEQDLGGLLLHSVSGRLQLTLRLPLPDFHNLRVLSHLLQLFMQLLQKHTQINQNNDQNTSYKPLCSLLSCLSIFNHPVVSYFVSFSQITFSIFAPLTVSPLFLNSSSLIVHVHISSFSLSSLLSLSTSCITF